MAKCVLITGASTGIGFATACHLQQSGFQVYGFVRKAADRKHLEASAPGVKALLMDVTKQDQITKASRALTKALEDADEVHLINNAGVALPGPIEAIDLEILKTGFEVNVFGLVAVTQEFLPWIRKTRGRIVNISSVSGLLATPYLGAYCSTKYAVEAISDALRRELLDSGVKVIVLEPGPIATPIWEKNMTKKDELLASMRQDRLPLYREEMEHFIDQIKVVAKTAIPVERVAEAAHRVLTQTRPPLRMIVSSRAELVGMRLAQLAPARLVDFAIQKWKKGTPLSKRALQ